MRVIQNAREAVAHGSVGGLEIQIATNGVEFNDYGKGVPAPSSSTNRALVIRVLHTPNGKMKPP